MPSAFFSSFFSAAHADTEEEAKGEEQKPDTDEKPAPEEDKPEPEDKPAPEEEDEPEDDHPAIREECKHSSSCAALTKHFEHCQEKVHAGQGFKGEDCVEELFHMMHCVDNCTAPKLFAKLK